MSDEQQPPDPPDDGDTTRSLRPDTAVGHPEQIGPYRILQLLGEGGMGIVYHAQQQQPVRRQVALKLIRPGMDTREVIARFESERQALAILNHPNIARVFDAGMTEQGRSYFVMEYVPGVPLTEYCDRNRLGLRQRLDLFTQVCQAVHHAHQKGIIHRDLKPSNILVALQDGQPVPKVIDFGVAKATNQRLTEKSIFTALGYLVGTPEYMSPEQAEMTAVDVDTTTDIYSLGVVLYELLTGCLPFDARRLRQAGDSEMRRIIREEEPLRPSARISHMGLPADEVAGRRQTDARLLGRRLRGELDWITMKAMAKDSTRRYASASEFAADVGRYVGGEPVQAGPPSATYRLRKLIRKHKGPVAAGAAVLGALTAGLIVSLALYLGAESAREQAIYRGYLASIAAADSGLQGHEALRSKQILESCPPKLRGWEWRHLWRKSDSSLGTLAAGGPVSWVSYSPDGRRVSWLAGKPVTLHSVDSATMTPLAEPDGGPDKVESGTPRGFTVASDPAGDRSIVINPNVTYGGTMTAHPVLRLIDRRERSQSILWEDPRPCVKFWLSGFDSLFNWRFETPNLEVDGSYRGVFSPDGSRVAFWSSCDDQLRVWDVETRRLISSVKVSNDHIIAAAFDPAGSLLATGHYSGSVLLQDVRSGRLVMTFKEHSEGVEAIAFDPRGTRIITGSTDRTVRLWDPSKVESIAIFRGHTGDVTSVAASPDGSRIVSGSVDGTLHIWRQEGGMDPVILYGHQAAVTSVAFSPDGARVVSGSRDRMIRLWDPRTEGTFRSLDAGRRLAAAVLFRQNGLRLITSTGLDNVDDDVVTVLDVGARTTTVATIPGTMTDDETGFRAVAVSADGDRIATSDTGLARIWETGTGRLLTTIAGPRMQERAIAFSPDGRHLVVGAGDSVKLWDAVTGADHGLLGEQKGGSLALVFSPDGSHVASGGVERTVVVWEVSGGSGPIVMHGHLGQVNSVRFSPDGRQVATGSQDGTVRVWDAMTGTQLRVLLGHEGTVASLAYNPEGNRIASVGLDGTMRVWDAASGELLLTLRGHGGTTYLVEFSPDGAELVTAALDGTVRIWESSAPDRLGPGSR